MMGQGAMMAPSIMKLAYLRTPSPKDEPKKTPTKLFHFMVSVCQASPSIRSVRSICCFLDLATKIWRYSVVFKSWTTYIRLHDG